MFVFKIFILALIVGASTQLGILLSKKYSNRVREIKDIKSALNMFKTKIKFTYEPLPSIFIEIGTKIKGNIGKLFIQASNRMKEMSAGEAWNMAFEDVYTNLLEEDITVIKKLGNQLGQTDLDGQISEIEIVNQFLEEQLQNANDERKKSEKMYRTLGIVSGLTIAIILI